MPTTRNELIKYKNTFKSFQMFDFRARINNAARDTILSYYESLLLATLFYFSTSRANVARFKCEIAEK